MPKTKRVEQEVWVVWFPSEQRLHHTCYTRGESNRIPWEELPPIRLGETDGYMVLPATVVVEVPDDT